MEFCAIHEKFKQKLSAPEMPRNPIPVDFFTGQRRPKFLPENSQKCRINTYHGKYYERIELRDWKWTKMYDVPYFGLYANAKLPSLPTSIHEFNTSKLSK